MSNISSASAPATGTKAAAWATLTATFFGIGRIRPGPGTWGSAATVILWLVVSRFIPVGFQWESAAALAAVAIATGVPAATQVVRATASKDPQVVVIDEVAGQLITFIAVPISWQSLVLGFILFRGFDITKPPPVRALERLPEGWGVVIDDVGAGLYALAVMHLLLHFRLLPR